MAEKIGLKSTIYYTALEGDYPGGSGGAFRDRAGNVIYDASREFLEAASIEGSAKLADGRVLNWATQIDGEVRWMETDAEYGLGSTGEHLVPLRSAAVDPSVIPLGSVLFIEETVGIPMGDGTLHNGIWYAVDIGGAIGGNRIDLFAGAGIESMGLIYDHGIGHLQALTTEIVGTMAPGSAQDGNYPGYEAPAVDPGRNPPEEPAEVPEEEVAEGVTAPESADGAPVAGSPEAPAEPAPPVAGPPLPERDGPPAWVKFKDGSAGDLPASFTGGGKPAKGSGDFANFFDQGFKGAFARPSQLEGRTDPLQALRDDLPAFKAGLNKFAEGGAAGGLWFKGDGFLAGSAEPGAAAWGRQQSKNAEKVEAEPGADTDWMMSQFADGISEGFSDACSFWDHY